MHKAFKVLVALSDKTVHEKGLLKLNVVAL